MRLRKRVLGAGAVVLALLATVSSVVAAGASEVQRVGPQQAPAKLADDHISIRSVTLVTGDRVTVSTRAGVDSLVRIDRGTGRSHVGFAAMTLGGHLRVIPADALPLLKADRIDPRLFDVTELLKFGYDDRRSDLPLIVTGADLAAVRSLARSAPSTHGRDVPRGTAMHTARASLGKLWASLAGSVPHGAAKAPAGPKVWVDGIHRVNLKESVPQIGAPSAWAAGFTGAGVKVGIVDTGIDADHPDLTGQVIAAQDFTGGDDTRDLVGHGTHVAATVASHDSVYRGVAPDAKLLSAKVCPDLGCPESAMLAGMEWATEQGAKIINISIGGADSPSIDPLEAAVADLTNRFGVLFVIAAGNSGDGAETIESPGSADNAITVGAVDKQDNLAGFSSRGPRRGDEAIKPDITAPGVNIKAAQSSDGFLGIPGQLRMVLSGTSMATPHVSGAAAILVQEHPDWTPAQLKEALMNSALRNPEVDVFAQGAGRVDVGHEIAAEMLAEPASVSFGRVAWPHDNDPPIVRPITFHNMSATDETLQLSLPSDAPAGVFTLSSQSVAVPAHGSASANITANTAIEVPEALYDGYVVARSADQSITIPIAVDKAPETHKVTAHFLDRSGQPAPPDQPFSVLVNPTTGEFVELPTDGSYLDVRPGTYIMSTAFFDFDGMTMSLIVDPNVSVTADTDLTIDARKALPVDIKLPFHDAENLFVAAGADIDTSAVFLGDAEAPLKLFVGTSDPTQTSPHLHGEVIAEYLRPAVTNTDSPAVVDLAYHANGRMFTGLTRDLKRSDLATIHADNASQGLAPGFLNSQPVWPDWADSVLAPGFTADLPSTRDEFYNTDSGIAWLHVLLESDDLGNEVNVLAHLDTLQAGQEVTEKRNRAVFEQGFPTPLGVLPAYARRGNVMLVSPNVLSDAIDWTVIGGFFTTTRITLDRNGEHVADITGNTGPTGISVEPGLANYRLGMDVVRDEPNTLSTEVNTVWTFSSDTTSTTGWTALPLTAVRFLPELDRNNTAPAGAEMEIPIDLDRQPGSATQPLRTLTVEVSFDDGATWHEAKVQGPLEHATLVLSNPGSGFVSLRAAATGQAGNTVTATVIRAYRVG